MVGRAARGDHDVLHVPLPDRRGDPLDRRHVREVPLQDRGLLADLVGEGHAGTAVATGSLPRNGIAPNSASASAASVGSRIP